MLLGCVEYQYYYFEVFLVLVLNYLCFVEYLFNSDIVILDVFWIEVFFGFIVQ